MLDSSQTKIKHIAGSDGQVGEQLGGINTADVDIDEGEANCEEGMALHIGGCDPELVSEIKKQMVEQEKVESDIRDLEDDDEHKASEAARLKHGTQFPFPARSPNPGKQSKAKPAKHAKQAKQERSQLQMIVHTHKVSSLC